MAGRSEGSHVETELTPARLRVLTRGAWFGAQPPSLRQALVQRGRVQRHAPRSLVYAAGSPPGGFHVVLAGEVRLEHLSRSGKFAFYHSLGVGDTFGLLSELDGSRRFSDARAMGRTETLHLPHADCQDLYRNDPAARQAFIHLICQNLHTTLDMLVEEHSAPPRAQIASILVSIFSRSPGDGREMPKLTQEALAAMAGVSRQTVSKVLHALRGEGLIAMQYGKLAPLDLARLHEIARG